MALNSAGSNPVGYPMNYKPTIEELNDNVLLFADFNLFYRKLDVYCEKYKDSPYAKVLMKLFENEENGEMRIDNVWEIIHRSNVMIHIKYKQLLEKNEL